MRERAGTQVAGVVDEQVDPAHPSGRRHKISAVFVIGHISRDGHGARQSGRNFRQWSRGSRIQHQPPITRGETSSKSPPQPA